MSLPLAVPSGIGNPPRVPSVASSAPWPDGPGSIGINRVQGHLRSPHERIYEMAQATTIECGFVVDPPSNLGRVERAVWALGTERGLEILFAIEDAENDAIDDLEAEALDPSAAEIGGGL